MDPAIMGAIIIACCFAAGVFETGRRKKNRKDEGEHAFVGDGFVPTHGDESGHAPDMRKEETRDERDA